MSVTLAEADRIIAEVGAPAAHLPGATRIEAADLLLRLLTPIVDDDEAREVMQEKLIEASRGDLVAGLRELAVGLPPAMPWWSICNPTAEIRTR
jgi:hypothetical protein